MEENDPHRDFQQSEEIIHILQFFKNSSTNNFEIIASPSTNWMTHQNCILDNDSTQYVSFDKVNSYIQINFTNHFIELSGYILNTSINALRYMKNWALFGLNIDNRWIIIDEHCDDDIPHSSTQSLITIPLFSDGSKFKSIKLVQTGPNNKSDNTLSIRYFDLLGKLYPK